MYIIKDWAGNILNHRGRFNLPQLTSPMCFKTFDDGWNWVYSNIHDETAYDDIFVEELNIDTYGRDLDQPLTEFYKRKELK